MRNSNCFLSSNHDGSPHDSLRSWFPSIHPCPRPCIRVRKVRMIALCVRRTTKFFTDMVPSYDVTSQHLVMAPRPPVRKCRLHTSLRFAPFSVAHISYRPATVVESPCCDHVTRCVADVRTNHDTYQVPSFEPQGSALYVGSYFSITLTSERESSDVFSFRLHSSRKNVPIAQRTYLRTHLTVTPSWNSAVRATPKPHSTTCMYTNRS